MEGDRVATVGRAEPEVVRGDGPDLADEHQRREAIAEGVERLERRDGVLAADEELALELVAVRSGV